MLGEENMERSVEYNSGAEVEQLRAEIAKLREDIATLRSEIAVVKATVGGLDDIQGDENVAPGNGFVELDRSVPKHPVIRFRADRMSEGGDSVEVVVGDVYDIETHTYKQYKRTISGIKLEPATQAQETGETIFITTPISSELLN